MGTTTKKLNKEPKELSHPQLNFSGEDLAVIYKGLRKLPVEEAEDLIYRMNKYASEMNEFNKQQNGKS